MASHIPRRGLSLMLSTSSSRGAPSSYRIRPFSSTHTPSAFASSPTYRAATTSTPAKPAATKSTTTSASKPTSTTSSTTAAKAATSTSNYPAPKPSSTTSTAQRTVTPSFPAKDPPTPTARTLAAETAVKGQRSLTSGLSDQPPEIEGMPAIDWTRSFHGLAGGAFTPEQQEILLAPTVQDDVEVKPDGILYLPEIKYRRILNRTFGPGGWGLAPRGETIVTGKLVTREYGLVVQGRLVAISRGEQQYFDPEGIPTATEGCKSNALMRCCKDLGIASELWDPRFIRKFTAEMTKEVWVEHVVTKKKKKIVLRKDDAVRYPFKEV